MDRKDFIARVVAESDFIKQLKLQNGQEYAPRNYYGGFLVRQIEELQVQQEQRQTV